MACHNITVHKGDLTMPFITDRLTELIGDLKRESKRTSERLEADLERLAHLSNEICKESMQLEKDIEGD